MAFISVSNGQMGNWTEMLASSVSDFIKKNLVQIRRSQGTIHLAAAVLSRANYGKPRGHGGLQEKPGERVW